MAELVKEHMRQLLARVPEITDDDAESIDAYLDLHALAADELAWAAAVPAGEWPSADDRRAYRVVVLGMHRGAEDLLMLLARHDDSNEVVELYAFVSSLRAKWVRTIRQLANMTAPLN